MCAVMVGRGMVRMVPGTVAAVTLAIGAAVALPDGQAAGQASCFPVSPATHPPGHCFAMTDPDAAGLAIGGVPGGPAGGTPETEWFDYAGGWPRWGSATGSGTCLRSCPAATRCCWPPDSSSGWR